VCLHVGRCGVSDMNKKYDLLLQGGEVIDPAQGIRGVHDVALAGGKVALVAEHIPEDDALQVVDVKGKLVTPGLVDIHGHYTRRHFNYIDPDKTCLPNGVTTSVDAGGLNWDQFSEAQERIFANVQTRLYCLLRVRQIDAKVDDESIKWARENPNLFVGCKVSLGQDTRVLDAMPLLEKALQVAERAQTRLVVHVGCCPVPLGRILKRLRPGDIATHIFHGEGHNILDWDHKVRPEVWDAVKRGILLDVGHCIVYYDARIARTAMEQGLLPNTISTDMSVLPFRVEGREVVYNLPEVMSICMESGMTLDQVVQRVTSNAAAAIGKSGELGSLRPGTVGDVTVLELQEGNFRYLTGFFGEDRKEVMVKRKLTCFMTVRSGQVWKSN
jgi:dihydroorotase